MTHPLKHTVTATLVALSAVSTAPAHAAEAYPARPIRVVVPLFTGAGTDIVARQFSGELAKALGQSIVVDNRPGASTTLGTNLVAKSTPDGHTLLVATTSTLSVLPNIMKPPYDTLKDLQPVASIAVSPFVYVVNAEGRHRSLNDLLGAAKAAPGKVTFGSSGTGTITHMAVELLAVVAKVNMTHVPYKGVTGAHVDVLGGRIDFVADGLASTMGQIKAGRFRPIAITSPKRSPLLPNVPTVAELGLREAESDFLTGVIVAAGTPKPIVARLEAETLKIARSPEFKAFLDQQGYEVLAYTTEEFVTRVRTEQAKWAQVVRERNIKVE